MSGAASEWDRFWRYDRLSSFETGPGAPNYSDGIAEGWNAFFDKLPDGARIVDLCTGNGAIAVLAVEAGLRSGKTFSVTGVDFADIEPANFVTSSAGAVKQVRFVGRTPVEQLPFEDGAFDAVVSQFGIEYSDLARSLPEAARVAAVGGRVRFAMHAAEGDVVRDTHASLADANFLLNQSRLVPLAATSLDSLTGWERGTRPRDQAQADHARFKASLAAVERYEQQAMDRLMLMSVRREVVETFNTHRSKRLQDQLAQLDALAGQVRDHRARQLALVKASVSKGRLKRLAAELGKLGFEEISTSEQRREGSHVAHVIEGRKH